VRGARGVEFILAVRVNVSIVIPCWNEARNLGGTIKAARRAAPGAELIVADGGSTDASVQIGKSLADRLVSCPIRQRAAQMNLGAQTAGGSVFIFLHADTLLAPGAGEALRRALVCERVVGGGFARRFDSDSPLLKLTCALAEVRCRIFGWFLGCL
jgi:glycosyltransferase involved in cell wall biosynthesis